MHRAIPLSWVALCLVACGARTELAVDGRGPDAGSDAGSDAGLDAGSDAGTDAGTDAGSDAGTDAGTDAGSDAGTDAGSDAGTDAGTDAGMDAGRPRIGCADGAREGFRDLDRYPDVAACAGGWDRPGMWAAGPTCARRAGNDGALPSGRGCSVADLCEAGFHVCSSAAELAARSPDGCSGSHDALSQFFAIRQSGPGCGVCATGTMTGCTGADCRVGCAPNAATVNDVFGCGTLGSTMPLDPGTCGPLDRFSNNLCGMLPSPWECGSEDTREAANVIKRGSASGGVVCCRD